MKTKLFILMVFAFISIGLYGQTIERFRNFHGLNEPGGKKQTFEAEGYDIFIENVDYGLDQKDLLKISKKYAVTHGQHGIDSVLKIKTISGAKDQKGIIVQYSLYLFPVHDTRTTIIGFVRALARDVNLERDFVRSCQSGKIPDFVITKAEIDSINFAGRTIQLGPLCQWVAPHHIQCPDQGQISWSIFNNLKQAEEFRDISREIAKGTSGNDEQWITLKFEGQETKALRTKARTQAPKLVVEKNVLVVYYITSEVRGKYVTCILSQNTDEAGADKLPPLLSEVIELM